MTHRSHLISFLKNKYKEISSYIVAKWQQRDKWILRLELTSKVLVVLKVPKNNFM